mmetsp:Transcript_2211/g.3558  ORF Transcript_2211/g.3558 Transcript_2211/m.3558 type:complete len:146 (-) Transcript_2211:899-1336(-)
MAIGLVGSLAVICLYGDELLPWPGNGWTCGGIDPAGMGGGGLFGDPNCAKGDASDAAEVCEGVIPWGEASLTAREAAIPYEGAFDLEGEMNTTSPLIDGADWAAMVPGDADVADKVCCACITAVLPGDTERPGDPARCDCGIPDN